MVEHATRSPESPRKWQLRVRLQSVEGLYGGTFVHEGEMVDSFAFDLPGELSYGHELVEEAEYLGGPRGGTLRLHQMELDPS